MNISALSATSTTTVSTNKRSSAAAATTSTAPLVSTVVTLSPQARQAAVAQATSTKDFAETLPSILLPSPANIAKLAQRTEEMRGATLDGAGIPRHQPFELVMFELVIEDAHSLHITAKGNRADAEDIEGLINNDKQLQMAVRNPYMMTRGLPQWERIVQETLDFQSDYAGGSIGGGGTCGIGTVGAPIQR